mgnify:CR=1 FL=1
MDIELEKQLGLNRTTTLINFGKKINQLGEQLNELLDEIIKEGKSIAGYGAPAKVVTLMSYYNLNYNNIKLIVDDSEIKQNKYIPGTQIQITSSEILKSNPPKYIIIFAWNLYKDILKRLKYYKKINYIIIPLPKFKIIKLK